MGIKVIFISTLLVCSALMPAAVQAQSVEPDFTVHEISNKKYYLHEVAPKQTLYGISKAYNTTVTVINENNPEVSKGLKIGMQLRIPLPGQDKGVTYKKHTVQPKETLYGISKKYHLSIEDILSSNPALNDGLRVGMELRIPNKSPIEKAPQQDIATMDNAQTEATRRIHAVKPKETWFSLSQDYNVPIPELKKANPSVKALKIGENIVIPQAKKAPTTIENKPQVKREPISVTDDRANMKSPLNENIDLTMRLKAISFDSLPIASGDTLQISYMLPFFLDMNDTLQRMMKHKKHLIYQKSVTALHMYHGALLAIDSLEKQGIKVDAKFYETQDERGNNNDSLLAQHMRDSFLINSDVIFGPLYLRNFETLAEFSRVNHIPILSPVPHSSKVLKGNPYIFKLIPGMSHEFQAIKDWVSTKHDTDHVLVLDSRDIRDRSAVSRLTESKKDSNGAVLNTPIKNAMAVNMGGGDDVDLKYKLKDSMLNVIVIPSQNESFVTQTLKALHRLSGSYNILVYGLSPWQKYHYIDVKHMVGLNVHIPVAALMTPTNKALQPVRSKYYESTGTYPSDYSMVAFDATLHFAQAFKHANGKLKGLADYRSRQISHVFSFQRYQTGDGWQNAGLIELEFEDYTLKEANE